MSRKWVGSVAVVFVGFGDWWEVPGLGVGDGSLILGIGGIGMFRGYGYLWI